MKYRILLHFEYYRRTRTIVFKKVFKSRLSFFYIENIKSADNTKHKLIIRVLPQNSK
nr:MAG TPA: hypothetical protein [Caudoviricetes sp.]